MNEIHKGLNKIRKLDHDIQQNRINEHYKKLIEVVNEIHHEVCQVWCPDISKIRKLCASVNTQPLPPAPKES